MDQTRCEEAHTILAAIEKAADAVYARDDAAPIIAALGAFYGKLMACLEPDDVAGMVHVFGTSFKAAHHAMVAAATRVEH